ncbi:MAG TPA: hypothetical protein VFE58_07180 [Tepidisphaeraceae bacterium]|jgi:hypothetical protein|nr:hypothetical protein [Tepidisphaeraceae bacterium]
MLTVPSCDMCNTGIGDGTKRPMSEDEEYMRTVMCMAASNAGPHPVVDALTQGPIIRQLQRRPGLAFKFAETLKMGWGQTPSGFFIPNQSTVSVDANRLVRVITKITKGLFYYHMTTPLPTSLIVRVMLDLPVAEFYQLKELLLKCSNIGVRAYPDKVFTYIGARSIKLPGISMWLMSFYNRFSVFAVTTAREDKHLVFGEIETGNPILAIDL